MTQETSRVVFAPARHLPAPLIAARAAVMHKLNCLDINLTARRTLYGILAFVATKNLKQSVFPRRETLRQEALLGSEGTLYRGLLILEERGYITREQTRQKRTGKFHVSPIVLTDKAILLLGLNKLIHEHRSVKVEDGLYKERTKENQSIQKTSSGEDSAIAIDAKTRLPVEVLPLLQLDVKKPAVCMLMREAKKNRKRLSVVMKAVWHNIYLLRNRDVVAYLLHLIRQDADFSTRAAEYDNQRQRSRYQSALDGLDARYDGWSVVKRTGERIGVFVHSDSGIHRVQAASGVLPVNIAFAKRFVEGEFRIVPPSR